MRIGLIQEAETPKGMSHYHRYHEVLDEVTLADEMGFDFWGTSEQHFLTSIAPISAPETFYAAVAERTSQIIIRHSSVLMLAFNHPIRIAERLATLDIIAQGRLELYTARSNSAETLDPFGVNPDETREQWRETFEVVIKALTDEVLEHDGKFWKIPPTNVVPRLYRRDPMPVGVICTSKETYTMAGELGLGVLSNDTYLGWDHVGECGALYREAIKDPKPFGNYPVTNRLGFCPFTANCAETQEKAIETGRHVADGFFRLVMALYEELAERSSDYVEFGFINKLKDKKGDYRFLMEHTPSVILGTPDDFIEALKRFESLGYDEVALRIDGFGHEQNKKAIELVGKYVIPEFKSPSSIIGRDPREGQGWEGQGPRGVIDQYAELGVPDLPRYLT